MASLVRTLRARRGAVAIGAVVVVVAAGIVAVTRGGGDERPVPQGRSVVVIMTDDQTLASLATMPRTQELLVDEGTSYTTALTSFPNCCPSRATYLTGQYAHTTGVLDNVEPHGGVGRFDPSEALPVALADAGYDTIHVGKYLNGWGADGDVEPPPGWTRWFGLVDPSTYSYTDFTVSVDGEERSYEDAYSTDVLAEEAVAQIRSREGDDRPFFLSFTPLAPHAESAEAAAGRDREGVFTTPVAPPRHEDAFAAPGSAPDPGPAYDEEDVSDKPIRLRRPPLSATSEEFIERYQGAELGALAAVDDAVAVIVAALDETDRLADTVVVFTSDNGFMHGQHRIVSGKFVLYEPAVRVPLVIRGPGFASDAEVSTPVVNADLAPTIAAVARVDLLQAPDGVDLRGPAVVGTDDRAVLLEIFTGGQPAAQGVRTRRWAFITHDSGERELYDLDTDPDQLENRAGDPALAAVERDLRLVLTALEDCRADDCDVGVPTSVRERA